MLTIRYKNFYISYSINLDNNTVQISCTQYQTRHNPSFLVDVKYNDTILEKTINDFKPSNNMFEFLFDEAKELINKYLKNN